MRQHSQIRLTTRLAGLRRLALEGFEDAIQWLPE
jgi:hypothetical protein